MDPLYDETNGHLSNECGSTFGSICAEKCYKETAGRSLLKGHGSSNQAQHHVTGIRGRRGHRIIFVPLATVIIVVVYG